MTFCDTLSFVFDAILPVRDGNSSSSIPDALRWFEPAQRPPAPPLPLFDFTVLPEDIATL